jgi:uncharacterized protein (TIGR02300 family)
MATKQARGTKRTCQNPECGSRFYDLSRRPIVCPICEQPYVIASAPLTPEAVAEEPSKAKKEFADSDALAPEDAAAADTDSLAEVEEAENAVAAEDDETFLEEEEEDGGDVSGIIGGVSENEDEP